jgi:hypothetical protein
LFKKGWYCECKNGTRTLGCCCHVAAFLYFLAFARHTNTILRQPAKRVVEVFPETVINIEKRKRQKEEKPQPKKRKLTKKSMF